MSLAQVTAQPQALLERSKTVARPHPVVTHLPQAAAARQWVVDRLLPEAVAVQPVVEVAVHPLLAARVQAPLEVVEQRQLQHHLEHQPGMTAHLQHHPVHRLQSPHPVPRKLPGLRHRPRQTRLQPPLRQPLVKVKVNLQQLVVQHKRRR